MPNWCSNCIEIVGPKTLIKDLWTRAQPNPETDLGLLAAMRPEPSYDNDEEWFGWRTSSWGTKWDVDVENLRYEEFGDNAMISGMIDTAWSPPIEAFQFFAEENSNVFSSVKYYEPGIGFVGRWSTDDGDDCYDLSGETSDTIKETIPLELDELFAISDTLASYEDESV